MYVYKYIQYTMILPMMRCHEDTVMLHSTTGPYGRPMLEVAYGEILLLLYRGCMGDDNFGRVIRVSA